jgi:hypothetical protein
MAWTCTVASEQDLIQQAKAQYEQLKKVWAGSYSNYWTLGNSFDTVIDYFNTVDGSDAQDFGPLVLPAYGRSLGYACWFDDYGWWGIATLKAVQSGRFDNASTRGFRTIHHLCWAAMEKYGTKVWDNNAGNPALAPLQPRFPGGVWNCDWSGTSMCGDKNNPPTLPSECSDNSQGGNLNGIQNTVTNGLFLVLALRLYEATSDPIFLQAAKREYQFLTSWFTVPTEPQNRLLWTLERGALVRERVANYLPNFGAVCGYSPEMAWSGDQGIIAGGMVDWMIANPADNNPNSAAFKNAAGILKGVAASTSGALQPWIEGADLAGDPGDYSTGAGVFMRYLLYVDQKNAALRSVTRAYQKIIDATVKAYLNDNPPPDEGADQLTRPTNRLAILVAAIVLSKN